MSAINPAWLPSNNDLCFHSPNKALSSEKSIIEILVHTSGN